jgi:hypothetical protein
VAFRDDNEALRAKVKGLQDQLDEAKATVAHLRGETPFSKSELLPPQTPGFARRVRTIEGPIDDYEGVVELLQRGLKVPMETRVVGEKLHAKSSSLEVTVLPGQGSELLLVFDESSSVSYLPAILFFAFGSLGAVGGVQAGDLLGALGTFLIGVFVSGWLAYSSKRNDTKEQARRDKLFVRVVRFLERHASRVRVSQETGGARQDVDERLVESEESSSRRAAED